MTKEIIGLPDNPPDIVSVSGIASQLMTKINPLDDTNHSISPASGYFGPNWPASGAIPQRFSVGGWTTENRGVAQQTFLGASIRSFGMNGGFGDSSSTLSIELINDEFNKSDGTAIGIGDDVYHNGQYDKFAPPIAGSPVFFKFGENLATVEEAYRKTFDDLYSMNTFGTDATISDGGEYDPANFTTLSNGSYVDLATNTIKNLTAQITGPNRGKHHLVFGGILQSYTQNRGPGGNPAYSVQVIDPREILSNTVLLLNNYAGTVYNQTNILNIYGFLEYNPTKSTKDTIQKTLSTESILKKNVANDGNITFTGDDTYSTKNRDKVSASSLPKSFPITGTGFSRRGSQGIPYYRIKQAINALMQYDGILPEEYAEKGFGGSINFRGFNYVVDFGTLPDLPGLYYLDFDQINLLELAMEICDVASRELFVTLLPVINHPACSFLHSWNTANGSDPSKLIAGIIRLDAIDRSKQPTYGSIKKYIDNLALQIPPIYVENQDVGYELANVTTDKFIVGAQEIDMCYFSDNADKDNTETFDKDHGSPPTASVGDQWKLETSLKQQILPYYGMLGKHAVTIPKGFGAYQQILLDATSLNANGVGSYYVATEMELRCAMISFDRWKDFLKLYNDTYLESIESDDSEQISNIVKTPDPGGNSPPIEVNKGNYAVSVPRSVFDTYATTDYGSDGLPFSPCNPPYGYPLYYKRMTKIGIPEGGLTDIQSRYTTVITNFAELKSTDKKNFKAVLGSQFQRLKQLKENAGLTEFEQAYFDSLMLLLEGDPSPKTITETVALVEQSLVNNKEVFAILPKIAKKNTENAMKVYDFVKNVAEECLGKKFLVKIPKRVNIFYENEIKFKGGGLSNDSREYSQGPFGFKPRPVSSIIGYEFSSKFKSDIKQDRTKFSQENMIRAFLGYDTADNYPSSYAGALSVNHNPISEQYEYNYSPVNQGGFFNFDLFQNTLSAGNINNILQGGFNNLPLGVKQCLIPQDLTHFLAENGRITPYVRFDHSEHLSLEYINKSDMSQQVKVANFMIPDLSYALDNVNGVPFSSFPDTEAKDKNKEKIDLPEQVAFVKCTVDDNFFMPPKTKKRSVKVHAQTVKDIGQKSLPQKIYIPDEDKYVDSFTYYQAHYVPTNESGSDSEILDFDRTNSVELKTYLINTELDKLDTENVYALITLPGRIVPTKDARFRDGPFQTMNADKFKHFMTMDTVTGLAGFDKPATVPKPSIKTGTMADIGDKLTKDEKYLSYLAAKKAIESLSFGLPQQINFTMPSPVYPNLVALPLMSKERCYGPWVSSQLDTQATLFKNIGGRVEFIKDENLSPWNYAGYQLMHEAGRLQAEFSNSLMLFSERGGFSIPGVPRGASLGKALIDGGPLVTNIDISVSEGGIKTTYKMDLYTSSFGKLQKQKQDQISKISRERQRLVDERNALIRKGLGKSQTSLNYQTMYDTFKSGTGADIQQFGSPLTQIVASVKKYTGDHWSSDPTRTNHSRSDYAVESTVQDDKQMGKVAQQFLTEDALARSYYNTASASITDIFTPISQDVYHPNMSSKPNPFSVAKSQFYIDKTINVDYDDSDTTKYGDA
jgi:hypothetical protein